MLEGTLPASQIVPRARSFHTLLAPLVTGQDEQRTLIERLPLVRLHHFQHYQFLSSAQHQKRQLFPPNQGSYLVGCRASTLVLPEILTYQ